jgi:rubrerythrin
VRTPMLTWNDLNERDEPCPKCRGRFRVSGRLSSEELRELRTLMDRGQGISAIRLIRDRMGAGLRDAKGFYEHITVFQGRCRQCSGRLDGNVLSDCPACGALNIDA